MPNATKKSIAAQLLGRLGGEARAKLSAAELTRIGKLGGRPKKQTPAKRPRKKKSG